MHNIPNQYRDAIQRLLNWVHEGFQAESCFYFLPGHYSVRGSGAENVVSIQMIPPFSLFWFYPSGINCRDAQALLECLSQYGHGFDYVAGSYGARVTITWG